MRVTAAGVDTWSPSWYVDPDGRAGRYMRQFATVPGAANAKLLPEPVAGHRVGWFQSGLVFAEGHPDPEGLCAPGDLPMRFEGLEAQLIARGVPLVARERAFGSLGATSEGRAGLRRLDATVNLEAPSRPEGLAVLGWDRGVYPGLAGARRGAVRS